MIQFPQMFPETSGLRQDTYIYTSPFPEFVRFWFLANNIIAIIINVKTK